MNATLIRNDRVSVNQLVPQPFELTRGDMVVFTDPGNWLGAEADNSGHLVKRVIGLAGDVVSCCSESGQLSVNGIPLTEPYTMTLWGAQSSSAGRFSGEAANHGEES